MVHLDRRKILVSNHLYTIQDNLENMVARCAEFYTRADWFNGYFYMTRLCYSQRLEDVYKTLINVAEAYFLLSNRASNIITLKVTTKLMFLKNIIHKSEASYLCCYQKRSYTESIWRSFRTQYLCQKFFSVRDYNGRFQDWAKQNKVRSLTTSNCNRYLINLVNGLSNQKTRYQKTATLKPEFL